MKIRIITWHVGYWQISGYKIVFIKKILFLMKPKQIQKLVGILKNRNQHDEGQVFSLNCCLEMNLRNVKRNSLQSIGNKRCKVSVDLDKRRKLPKVSKMKRDTERLRYM